MKTDYNSQYLKSNKKLPNMQQSWKIESISRMETKAEMTWMN